MSILSSDWLTSGPNDIEFKKYKLLAATKKVRDDVTDGRIFVALDAVEQQLYSLYRYQGTLGSLENDSKILKGINLDTMELDFVYPDNDFESDLLDLCNFAINELEDLFKYIRGKWRIYSKKISITEVPVVRPTINTGYVLIEDKNNKDNILIYYYENVPKNDWKKFELKHVDTLENIPGNVSKYIQNIKGNEDIRFFRLTHTLKCKINECILPIIKYNLFYKLTVSTTNI